MISTFRATLRAVGFLACVAGCTAPVAPTLSKQPTQPQQPAPTAPVRTAPPQTPLPGREAVRNFVQVVQTVEPVAEEICRRQAPRLNCDFQIVVDTRPGNVPNAFQTVNELGQPIVAFTIPLIAQARNKDELAFIMSHEAAHHIQGHIDRQNQIAIAGARLMGGIAAVVSGGRTDSIRAGQQLGAQIGARAYSKDFELEADRLGTIITYRAGYNPLRGAEFFFRIPDPGDRFLGTHPANAARLRVVRETAAQLR